MPKGQRVPVLLGSTEYTERHAATNNGLEVSVPLIPPVWIVRFAMVRLRLSSFLILSTSTRRVIASSPIM